MTAKVDSYPYNPHYFPSAPVVTVRLGSIDGRQASGLTPALIDTGADVTLVPFNLLQSIGAQYVGDAVFSGITGDRKIADVYLVTLMVGLHRVPAVRVIALAEDDEVIVGRDILNQLVVTLNGPAGVTEIAE